MIKAVSKTGDGGQLVWLGLTPGNIEKLQQDEPILVDLGELEAPGVDLSGTRVLICFGPTERQLLASIRALGIEVPGGEDALREIEAEHRRKGTTP